MVRPTARVLAMLEMLQAGRQRTVGEFADRLGVDERTVRRYAQHLTDLGIPVQAERGRYGGYRLSRGHKLPPLMLTDEEAVAVALGLGVVARGGSAAGDGIAVESALAKLMRVLPQALASRIEALLASAQFDAPLRVGVLADVGVLLALASATQAGRTVEIAYTSWDGKVSQRELDSYGLVLHSGRWYVAGYDHSRTAVRTFRVDRIAAVTQADATFDVPPGFDAGWQVASGIGAVGWSHEFRVRLRTTLAEATEHLPPSAGRLTDVGDGVLFEGRADRLDGMARMLAGIGWDFDIIAPDALREAVLSLSDRLRASAQRSDASAQEPAHRAGGANPRDCGS